MPPASGSTQRQERFAHNSYLQQAAEAGTLGLLAFVGMIGAGLWCAFRPARGSSPRARSARRASAMR